MHPTAFVKPTTPVSTVSSILTDNATNVTTAVQSGPYTKAQFQNTMEGSRSVKNAKEVEQLLRDYPAALELYRTGRYKVKLKNEADVERVILVEKRTTKNTTTTTTNSTKTTDLQQNTPSNPAVSTNINKIKEDVKKEKSRSRTHSRDHVVETTSLTDNNDLVQTTTSSIRMPSNTQPKVDNHRTLSKERDVSITSQPKQQQTHQRSHSRDSRSKVSHSKQKGKKSGRDHQNAIVPYIPNAYPAGNMWQQSRALQPYYSHPILPQQPPMSNMYMPSPYISQQNPLYQQPYYYGQPPFPAVVYQKPSVYPPPPSSSTIKSTGTVADQTPPSTHNYPSLSQTKYNANHGTILPPSFHPNHQQYPHPHAMYQSQMPFQVPLAWPATANRPTGYVANNNNNTHVGNRQGSQHRARSVDTSSRDHPPVRSYNQQQQQQTAPTIHEHHHHQHRHHHHRSHPPNVPIINTGPSVETGKDQNVSLKETTATANNGTNGEKLTIRQLNEIFVQTDPAGRLPYSSIPNILQRFGIALSENDLTSAAQGLDYNTNEPLSARRLVHVLIKLGKIAKSTQQRPPASPTILPEDREVNDIMTQRRVAGALSTHIHSSAYPNYWY